MLNPRRIPQAGTRRNVPSEFPNDESYAGASALSCAHSVRGRRDRHCCPASRPSRRPGSRRTRVVTPAPPWRLGASARRAPVGPWRRGRQARRSATRGVSVPVDGRHDVPPPGTISTRHTGLSASTGSTGRLLRTTRPIAPPTLSHNRPMHPWPPASSLRAADASALRRGSRQRAACSSPDVRGDGDRRTLQSAGTAPEPRTAGRSGGRSPPPARVDRLIHRLPQRPILARLVRAGKIAKMD
jgi:hypothetical protein